MPKITVTPPAGLPALRKFLPLLLLLFFGSGCAALIYEIVWLQLLEFVIGSSGVSLGVLLGTFMGGMCLGSLLLPRMIPSRYHPLRVYAILELGTGLSGVAILFAMPAVGEFYAGMAWHGVFVRAIVAAACLTLPTMLMGATLPAVARFVESTPEGVSWMGFFYGGNLAGAVAGCILAGFFLLRIFDMPTAVYVAVLINIAASALALIVAGKCRFSIPSITASEGVAERIPHYGLVHLAIALSGFCALGAEVIWTRLLSLLMGGTIYTFSIILAVFLVGLGIGSSVGAMTARTSSKPRILFGICQLSLAAALAWAAFIISKSLPYWPIDPGLYTGELGPWHMFQIDMLRTAWTILPATILWGASFPLVLASVACRDQDPGRMVGGVYAANTVGAILGALGISMLIIPQLGTQCAERLLIMISIGAATLVLVSAALEYNRSKSRKSISRSMFSFSRIAGALLAIVVTVLLVNGVSDIPWFMIAWGRYSANYAAKSCPEVLKNRAMPSNNADSYEWYCTYVGEGMNALVAVTETTSGSRFFHGAGKVQASSQPQDMRLQRMLGHLSALACNNPEKIEDVLVIACGAGVTAGSFMLYPSIKRIVICDIEPLVPRVVAPMFGSENYHIVDGIDKENPRHADGKEISVIYDDGRHYLSTLSAERKFDVITSDPVDPWVKGSAALNTVEFYEICKSHLKPGGVMALWMPLYESNMASAKSMIATFFQVFPNGMLFSNDHFFAGYDAVLLGQADRAPIDIDRIETLLESRSYMRVKESLMEVGFGTSGAEPKRSGRSVTLNLCATFAGRFQDLQHWTQHAQINEDRNMRLQYLAGMWLNSNLGTKILESILANYRFPEDLFVGSKENIWILKQALEDLGRREKHMASREFHRD
jgi:spermidine synthase